jgi:hypothetical protein
LGPWFKFPAGRVIDRVQYVLEFGFRDSVHLGASFGEQLNERGEKSGAT